MSFRNRLALFFVLVVVVPMVSVAFVLFRLIDDNESGKADARLASRQDVVVNLTRELRRTADRAATNVGADAEVAAALRAGDRAALSARLRALARENEATRITIVRSGAPVADIGHRRAVFPTSHALVDSAGRSRGTLMISVADARPFAERVARVTGLEAVVLIDGKVVGTTLPGAGGVALPARGSVRVGSTGYRAASYDAPGFDRRTTRVTVLERSSLTAGARSESRLLIVALLAGFLILAVTLALFVARSLHRQLEGFLQAARRIGTGDFSVRVPTIGRDDFAQLGEEFNKMSRQLEERVEDLRVERERVRAAIRSIGDGIASNLDRDGLLEVVMGAAADGVGAGAGRASVRRGGDGPLVSVATTGNVRALGAALARAEAQAFSTGEPSDIADGVYAALALPLRSRAGSTTAVIAIARGGNRFSADERQLFDYLAGQAATSIENVDLHERVERQAVTDELTGLANRRRFEERLREEIERAQRFPEPVGLLLIDIDDFKLVNDRLGHQAGDEVLRHVARALREAARDIDLPARYGGEELALILPGAPLDGAVQVGERVRTAIERIAVPIEGGAPVSVTVSVGAASAGKGSVDAAGLVSAADDALYRAKRAGKNRTERAGAAAGVSAE